SRLLEIGIEEKAEGKCRQQERRAAGAAGEDDVEIVERNAREPERERAENRPVESGGGWLPEPEAQDCRGREQGAPQRKGLVKPGRRKREQHSGGARHRAGAEQDQEQQEPEIGGRHGRLGAAVEPRGLGPREIVEERQQEEAPGALWRQDIAGSEE